LTTLYIILILFFCFLFLTDVKKSIASNKPEEVEKKISESQRKLKDFNEQIEQEKKRIEKLRKDKRSIVEEIKKMTALIAAKNKELEVYRNEYEKNSALLNELQEKIEQESNRFSVIKERLVKRLRAVYKHGRFNKMEAIYNSRGYLELLEKIKLLQIASINDARLVRKFKLGIKELEGIKQNLIASRNRAFELLEKMERVEKEISLRKKEKERLLSEINYNEKKYLASLERIERNSEKLQDLIKKLLKEKIVLQEGLKKSGSRLSRFRLTKGNLPWPTEGEVVKFFGKQLDQEHNSYLYNKGITIRVKGEKKFSSIFPGNVLYADLFPGYGKLVIIDHGDGFYSIYGYASELYVKVGEKVTQGKILGTIGKNDSNDNGELYFEVRYKGNPQDPLAWLKGK